MKKVDILNVETGEYLGTVTTKYNSISTLFENVGRWMRRHPNYKYVSDTESLGIKWDPETYWVEEINK